MTKKISSLALFLTAFLVIAGGVLFPKSTNAAEEDFSIAAKAAISIDFETGKVFYNQNADTPMGIASITKIIGLYLVEEEIQAGKLNWEDLVTISDDVSALSIAPDLSNVPLNAGATYSVRDLFNASFIASGNAAIVGLAEKVAGSEPEFVDLMRKKVESWGIKDATLINASGLNNKYLGENIYPGTSPTDENLMSAKDMAIVARHFIKDFPEVLDTTAKPTEIFAAGTSSQVEMVNWNWMLPGFLNYKEGVDGFKTGTTDLAGACFLGTALKDGQRIITVVLNATNHENDPSARFVETGKLMDYTYDNWQQKEVIPADSQIPEMMTLKVKDGTELSTKVTMKDAITLWVRNDMDVTNLKLTPTLTKAAADKELQAPVMKGDKIGTVSVALAEDKLGYVEDTPQETEIQVAKSVPKANLFVLFGRSIKNFFSNLF